jgi:hypothetical protein
MLRLLRILTFTALASAILGAAAAAAANEPPPANQPPELPVRVLMNIKKFSGMVPNSQTYSLVCEIRNDTSQRRWSKAGGVPQVDSKPTIYTANVPDATKALSFLQEASQGQIVSSRGPTDGPTALYMGIIEGDVVSLHIRLLDDRSTEVYRNSAASVAALLAFGDANCAMP